MKIISEETRKKISLKLVGIKKGPMTEEHKQKIRSANLGVLRSSEARKNMSDARRLLMKNGFQLSKETKERLRKAATGRKLSQDARLKISTTLARHHIDLNHKNNHGSNILMLTNSNHARLHRLSYNYLVETGQILEYIEWFKKRCLVNEVTT